MLNPLDSFAAKLYLIHRLPISKEAIIAQLYPNRLRKTVDSLLLEFYISNVSSIRVDAGGKKKK